jgi:hypothetical protein
MDLFINLNENDIYEKHTNGEAEIFTPANPCWVLTIHTPKIAYQINEEDRFKDNVYSLGVKAQSEFCIIINNRGAFWYFCLRILGFGFEISRQSDY